jgi:hypothetical protein
MIQILFWSMIFSESRLARFRIMLPRSDPFGGNLRVRLGGGARGGVAFELGAVEATERPDRSAANQRRGVVEQSPGLAGQRRIAGITDRDEHVAHEARAPDAFDRAFREQRPEARIIKPREFGKPRCA